jgi:hypothetical protein
MSVQATQRLGFSFCLSGSFVQHMPDFSQWPFEILLLRFLPLFTYLNAISQLILCFLLPDLKETSGEF